ncbi:MAG: SEL1-like repeat protein [Terriglobales bacterium]
MISSLAAAILLLGSWLGQAAGPKPADLSATEISALQKAAEAGDPQAEFGLAQACDYGNGIAQNDQAAFSWYRKSAEQGYAPAQNAVGLMYRAGRGVESSKEQAVEWYRKAAKQKNAKAMFNLGTAYYNGDGVAINDISAFAWFVLAEHYGSEPAHDAVTRTAGSLQRWQASSAYELVGDMYEQGTDLPLDHRAAIDWYRQAAQLGEPSARVKLANFLVIQGGDQNYQEALRSCLEAAKQMYSPAALCAGLLYQKGLGTGQNLSEAAKWFGKSAQMGNAKAMLYLGEMYWDGTGVKQDRVAAYVYMLLASTADLPKAQQDKALYEQTLSQKELEKARKQAADWGRTHPTLGLKEGPRLLTK